VAYTLLLKTSDTGFCLPGTIKIDRATGKYAGAIQIGERKNDLIFIEIEPGEYLRFVMRDHEGVLISYTFRPNPDAPKFPESVCGYVTWWVGELFDGRRIAPASCVLSRTPIMSSSEPKPAPMPVMRSAVLPDMPQPVSMF
jgi:hypothetical protein